MSSMKVDLHLHSDYSDGNWSPAELVEHAVAIGLSTIALTDHDTTGGVQEAIGYAEERLEVIPGLEINTIWVDDAGERHDVHILGYFIDLENNQLQTLLANQRRARDQQVEELVERLSKNGMKISMAMIRDLASGSPIGKVHVTQAIVTAGGARDVTDAYMTYFKRDSQFYVPRRSCTPFQAVAAIAAAGGISSLAHPGSESHMPHLIEELSQYGLNGIEVYHRMNDESSEQKYLRLAEQLGLLITGGSDDHGPFEEHASLMGTIEVPCEVVARLKERADSSVALHSR